MHFPKFITVFDIQFTLHKASDLRRYLALFPQAKVQRYLWPYQYLVRKSIIRWQRTKRSKVYTLCSRAALLPGRRNSGQDFQLETEFVASSRRLEDCDWVEERVSEEAEEMLSTLVEVLGRVVLVWERLEEIVVFATKAQDGRTHFLDLPGIRTQHWMKNH